MRYPPAHEGCSGLFSSDRALHGYNDLSVGAPTHNVDVRVELAFIAVEECVNPHHLVDPIVMGSQGWSGRERVHLPVAGVALEVAHSVFDDLWLGSSMSQDTSQLVRRRVSQIPVQPQHVSTCLCRYTVHVDGSHPSDGLGHRALVPVLA